MLELISIQRFDEFIYRFIQQELKTNVQDISLWASLTTSMELYNGTIGEPTSSSLATIGDTMTGTFQWTRVIPPSHGPLLSGGLAVLR